MHTWLALLALLPMRVVAAGNGMLKQRQLWRAEVKEIEARQQLVTAGMPQSGNAARSSAHGDMRTCSARVIQPRPRGKQYPCKKLILPSDRPIVSLMGTYRLHNGDCRGIPVYIDDTTGMFLFYTREGFWVVYNKLCAAIFQQTHVVEIAVVEGRKNGAKCIRLVPCEMAQLL
jgi:hypothetical protein